MLPVRISNKHAYKYIGTKITIMLDYKHTANNQATSKSVNDMAKLLAIPCKLNL